MYSHYNIILPRISLPCSDVHYSFFIQYIHACMGSESVTVATKALYTQGSVKLNTLIFTLMQTV